MKTNFEIQMNKAILLMITFFSCLFIGLFLKETTGMQSFLTLSMIIASITAIKIMKGKKVKVSTQSHYDTKKESNAPYNWGKDVLKG